MKKVRNKQWIQSIIYYLFKWADWFSEYNFYKFVSHLADIFKVITDYKQKLMHKHKKTSQINVDKVLNSKDAPHKQMSRWDHVLYSVHDVLNETLKSCVFYFVCSRISTDFWVNYTTSYSVNYFFYFQSQLICQTIKFCCVKSKKCFNKNWH